MQPSRGRIEERLWRPSAGALGGRRHRRPQRIACLVPDPIAAWDPSLTAAVATLLGEADAAVRDLNHDAPQFAGLEALSRQLLRQESVGSSRIEGLVIGQRRLARAAAEVGRDEAASQIVGNVRAMEQSVELGARSGAFRREHLIAIHTTLLEATRDAHLAGVVREDQNWVGGSAFSPAGAEYVPPPAEYVEALLDDLVAFVNRADLPVVLQAAIAHAQFETIHPFADGNGRAGRCLIHVVYRRRALAPTVVPPISLVLAARAAEYVGGLTEYRFGDPTEWSVFFARVVVGAVQRARELAERLDRLREDWLERLGHPRRDASSRSLVDRLPAEPIITVARASELAGVSTTAADKAVTALERAGILVPVTERPRGRRWEAPDVFDLLDAFERDLTT